MAGGQIATKTIENVGDVASKMTRIPIVLLQNLPLIALLMLVAFALIGSREILIESSPFIAEHAVIFTAAFNAIITPIVDSIVIIVDIVKTIQAIVRKILHRSTHTHFLKPVFAPLHVEQVRRFFTDLPPRCRRYTNIGYTLSKATRAQTNSLLCPLVRITYPVPWMWKTTNALFGWGIVNAVPQGTYIPDGFDGNCELRQAPPDWLCIGLSSGYLIGEILLPLLIVLILWPYTFGPVLRLVYREVKLGLTWFFRKIAPS
ncbi:MAG: hypothetical protein CL678_00730 [Bdellovibrionaceae bacterium]|nr:hypothetical protein [Pseudobdellovibrionaceae bacterium]|tara:strand:- start:882 stop:1661 length:780 start_codon:yes stop_codon:yes gene_type:complete